MVFTQATKVAENLKARFHLAIRSLRKKLQAFQRSRSFRQLFPLQNNSHAPHPPPHQRAIRILFEIVVVFQKIPGSPTSKNSQPSHELLLLPEEFSLPGYKETVSSFPYSSQAEGEDFFFFFFLVSEISPKRIPHEEHLKQDFQRSQAYYLVLWLERRKSGNCGGGGSGGFSVF